MSGATDGVREAVLARGLGWPAPIEHHARLGSTNDRLKERAREGAPEWTVVLADEQTGGRGRQGRVWASPPGGLYLSVLLRPGFAAAGLIPLAAGVAVVDALAEHGIAARLKWPNDVLAGERKLAGLLAESSSSAVGLDWVVLGLGLNVQTLPAEVRETATSLHALGSTSDPTAVAATVLSRLVAWYDALRADAPAVLSAWRERAVPWWGRRLEVRSGGRAVTGVAVGLDAGGALLLLREDGSRMAVLSGEVTAVRLEAEAAARDPGR